MMNIVCTINCPDLNIAQTEMNRFLDNSIKYIAQDYSDEIKREITRQHLIDHGNMKNSILINFMQHGAEIVSGVKYLPYQNDGTGIYGRYRTPVVPKNKKFLVFDIAGKIYYRKSVKGVKGHHFVEKAYDAILDRNRIAHSIKRALRSCGYTVS